VGKGEGRAIFVHTNIRKEEAEEKISQKNRVETPSKIISKIFIKLIKKNDDVSKLLIKNKIPLYSFVNSK
jgi:hypothetical protein